jgi:hypothetical protein
MARKLKTYQTSLGFFDLVIVAPSMKAALEAWAQQTVPRARCKGKQRSRSRRRDHVEARSHSQTHLRLCRPLKVGDAVDAELHRFAVKHEGVGPVTQRGFHDAPVPAAPVVAVAASQRHGLALPLNNQANMKPLRPVGKLGPARRDAGVERKLAMPDR